MCMDAWPDWSKQNWGWRCIFISRLQNSCLSAIEALVPVASDYLKLDKHSTLGTYAELKYWQVACCATEATASPCLGDAPVSDAAVVMDQTADGESFG